MGASCPKCNAVRLDFSKYNFSEISEMNYKTFQWSASTFAKLDFYADEKKWVPIDENDNPMIQFRLFLMKCLRCNNLIDIEYSESTMTKEVYCIYCGQSYGNQAYIYKLAFADEDRAQAELERVGREKEKERKKKLEEENRKYIEFRKNQEELLHDRMNEEREYAYTFKKNGETPSCQNCGKGMDVVRVKKNPDGWNVTCQCVKCQIIRIVKKEL